VRYIAFVTEIPSGFRGVADVRIGGGEILIEERETGKTFSLTSSRTW
jgi:hypothetical protein